MRELPVARHKTNERTAPKTGKWFFPLFRYCIVTTLCVAAVVLLPLSLVWKQVCITRTSMRCDMLQDSLAVLNKEIGLLKVSVERLACSERLEAVARQSLGMEYPLSKEIVVLRYGKRGKNVFSLDSSFRAVVRKTLKPEKG